METGTKPPETRRSFDINANVEAMRYDIEQFGYVLPETREQVGNEQLSYLCESVDRTARTMFALRRDGDELVYFDSGKWRPYSDMLNDGLVVAQAEAIIDPRRQFLAEWAQNDFYHYAQMRRLRPGERYSWTSSYAREQETQYGRQFMRECGLVPEREMGFVYQANCEENDTVILQSQTVDRSDDQAFSAVLNRAAANPQADLDELVEAYDAVLKNKNGGHFYAGRREAELHENVWNQIRVNRDLVEYLLDGLESIAQQNVSLTDSERATRCHIYGVWALFKKRLDGVAQSFDSAHGYEGDAFGRHAWLVAQTQGALHEFAAAGRVLIGCGGAIEILQGEGLIDGDPDKVFDAIFGNKPGEDQFGPLTFKCTNGHSNTRPFGKFIDKCRIHNCTGSVGCGPKPKLVLAA